MDGERLGPYVIDRELGSGGMGTVYEARSESGDRVALKVVHPHLLGIDGFAERFLREAEVGRRIEHPNVVRTLDAGEVDGRPYIALEFVEGDTLTALLRELERVPETLCRHIGRECARGLAAIHAAGIVHRDMKPDNVLITPDHEVRLMDLGLARDLSGAGRVTVTGAFVGSPAYCPPEQFKGRGTLDARGDLYSLGVTLYELATGQRPFKGGSMELLMARIIKDTPPRPGRLCPQLSPFFESLLLWLLEKDPGRRVGSAGELGDLLDEGETGEWWGENATRVQTETRRPLRRIRIPRDTECLGREDDLGALRVAFDAAKTGDGRVILLEGEAGIGKSRLIDELIRRLDMDGEDVNVLYGSYPPGGAATAMGAFSAAYRAQLGSGGSAPYLSEAPLLAPAFDAVLRGDAAPESAHALTADSLKTAFVHVTRAIAAERPTIVVIDDLHFAPEEGRALFASLAMAVPGHPILLVGMMRPGLRKEWVSNIDRHEHVRLRQVERLGRADVARLLVPVIGTSLAAEHLAASIAATADGNPFFLFEIVRSLREGGIVTKGEDGSWATRSRVTELTIPATVQGLLDARMERLSNEERELLDCAACWGAEFDGRLVAAALEMRTLPALRLLGRLEKEHRLVRAAGGAFVFDHHAIQEHLYARIPEPIRGELHRVIASALEVRESAADREPGELDGQVCVDLCEHYLKGGGGESAVRYLLAAQTHLTNAYRHADMAALTERALALPDLLVGAEAVEILLRLVVALDRMGQRARQEECARRAVRLAEEVGDDALRGKAATALGILLSRTSRQSEAAAAFRSALDIAVVRGDREAEAGATGNLGGVFRAQGRLVEAHGHHERHLALSREVGDRAGEANATGNLGITAMDQGRLTEAREHHERHLVLSRSIGDRVGEARAMGNLGIVLKTQGRLSEARAQYERNLSLSREIGDRAGEARATGNLGGVFKSRGRLSEAMQQYERHLALSLEIGDRAGETIALHNLGSALGERGERDVAEERLLASLAVSEAIGFHYATAMARLLLGSLRVAAGNGAGGRESLAAARDVAAEMGLAAVETLARGELACLPGGDATDALAAFTEHEARLSPKERLTARWLLFRATGDRAHLEEAKRLLDEAVAHVDDETRDSMLTNLRVNREIMAAWDAEFGEEDGASSR